MSRPWITAGLVGCGLAWALVGCAAPKDARVANEELRDRSTEADAAVEDASPAAAPEAPRDAAPDRDFGDIERELASNEARLRALGVELPARAGEGEVAPTPDPQSSGDGTRSDRDVQGGGRPSTPKPGAQPSLESGKDKKSKAKESKADELDTAAGPEEVKAAGPRPGGDLDPGQRCAEICALSQGTCELRGAICDLADRHDDEDDYRSACVRADQDCDVAEEACRACSN